MKSIRELANQCDAIVTGARARLRAATTESERADAVCEEFAAKLAFERNVDALNLGSHPALAARVNLGEITLDEAITLTIADGDTEAVDLEGHLCYALDARSWIAFANRPQRTPRSSLPRILRAIDENDREGAIEILRSTGACPYAVHAVLRAYGRQAVFEARSLVARPPAIDPQLSLEFSLFSLAAFALALPDSNLRETANALADRVDQLADNEMYNDLGLYDPRASIAIALVEAGELSRAEALIQRVIDNPTGTGDDARARGLVVAALERLEARSPPERYAAIEQRAFDKLVRPHLRESNAWKMAPFLCPAHTEELRREQRIGFAERPLWWPLSQATDAEERAIYLRAAIESERASRGASALGERIETDRDFRDALLSWPVTSAIHPPASGDREPLIDFLLAAARSQNRAAIDALLTWNHPQQITATAHFFAGLPDALVRALLDRASRTPDPQRGNGRVSWMTPTLATASEAAKRRWAATLDPIAPNWARTEPTWSIAFSDETAITDALLECERTHERPSIELRKASMRLPNAAPTLQRMADRAVRIWRATSWQRGSAESMTALSLATHLSTEGLAALDSLSWSDEDDELAHCVLIACARAERSGVAAQTTLNSVRMRIQTRYTRPDDRAWMALVRAVFATPIRPTIEQAWVALGRPELYGYGSLIDDALLLDVVDELLALCDRMPPRDHISLAAELFAFVSEEARDRARAGIIEAFRAMADPFVPAAIAEELPIELVIERWHELVGERAAWNLDPTAVARVAGTSAIDRIGDAFVRSLTE